jgi:hypothetical protein
MSAPRQRRPRSVTSSLASIVLAVEFLIVVLASLVLFGLRDLPPAIALGGGGALLVLIAIAAALASRPVGIALGWVVQALLLLSGFQNPAVGIVALIFVALWVYSMIVARRIDRRTT